MREDQKKSTHKKLGFFQSAATELRTPLMIVLAAIEQNALPVNKTEREVLRNSTRQLLELTREFSRPGSQDWPSPVPIESICLQEFRDEILTQNKGKFCKKDIAFYCFAPQNIGVAIAHVHLTELVNNLVSNAWKYSPPGSRVALTFLTQENKLLISVKDEGEGIAVAEREKIFEPFYRTNVSPAVSGTGLGLAAVKRIAELYNGSAWVKQRFPNGSEFLVKLHVAVKQLASDEAFA